MYLTEPISGRSEDHLDTTDGHWVKYWSSFDADFTPKKQQEDVNWIDWF